METSSPSASSSSQVVMRKKSRIAPHETPRGRLLVTEIRIPFVWKERQYFKSRTLEQQQPDLANNGKKYVLFCIFYTESDMQSTQKVMVDSSMSDVVFNELLEFSNITPATKLYMEVFSYACSNGANKNYSPVRKLSRKLSRSLTRAFGRRCAGNPLSQWNHGHLRPKQAFIVRDFYQKNLKLKSSSIHADLHAAEYKQPHHQLPITSLPNFTKIADCQLAIDELVSCEEGSSHILTSRMPQKGSDRKTAAAHEIPLFGSFACRTAVQPYCATKEIQIGRVNVREIGTSATLSQKNKISSPYHCVLVHTYLYCYNADRDRRLMEMAVRIDKKTSLRKTADPSAVELVNQSGMFVLTFRNQEERRCIVHLLHNHIAELSEWNEAALNIRDMKLRPSTTKNELRRRGSLYDEIPISMQSATSHGQLRF